MTMTPSHAPTKRVARPPTTRVRTWCSATPSWIASADRTTSSSKPEIEKPGAAPWTARRGANLGMKPVAASQETAAPFFMTPGSHETPILESSGLCSLMSRWTEMDSQELLFSTLDGLEVLTTDVSEEDLVNIAVEVAQSATGSTIAYLHFLNDDPETIELVAWSEATLKHCQATHDRHYPLAAAGIWGDAARTGLPCIHNDYPGEAGRRGLPPGHVTLSRHLCVPVLEQGRVRMLIGVGNKYEPYEESDTRLLDIVARRTWYLVRQRRMVHRLLSIERQFVEMQNVNL